MDTPSKSAACAADKATKVVTAKINPRTMATHFYLGRMLRPTMDSVNGRRTIPIVSPWRTASDRNVSARPDLITAQGHESMLSVALVA